MDIHKPKPWHGVREFLKEYLIIVVGVLTALAAEQAAEQLHWHAEVADARETLQSEIAHDAALEIIVAAEERCSVDAAAKWIAWANGGARPPGMRSLLDHPTMTVWEAERAGAVTHMRAKERLAYADFYSAVTFQLASMQEESAVLNQLGSLIDLDRLSSAQADRLKEAASAARIYNASKMFTSLDLVRKARSLGVTPAPLDPEERAYTIARCAAVGAPPPNFSPEQPVPDMATWSKAGAQIGH